MSAQDFHRRHATRSGGLQPSFDPSASTFVPFPQGQGTSLPFMPPPPPGWHAQSGQKLPQADSGISGSEYPGRGHQVQSRGMLGNYPVFQQAQSHNNAVAPNGTAVQSSQGGTTARDSLTQAGAARENEEDYELDASTSPSVGEPLDQSSPRQTQTVTIPVLTKSKANRKKSKVKETKRPYLVPSRASGGVPNPTKDYITRSAEAPSLLPAPRQILVIIDLNGTLLHRPSHKKTSTFIERPFTRTFLDYCLRTFVVAIWSSAKPLNVQKMVPQILNPADQKKLVAVWGRDTLGLSGEDFNQRVQVYKRLERVWNDARVMSSHPEAQSGQKWDQTNTVLIDDSKEKARSQPYNLIQLPEFQGDINEAGFVLPQVHNYLNECAWQRDISSLIREKPFKFDPRFSLDAQRNQNGTANE